MNRSFQSLATALCLTLAASLLISAAAQATAGSPGTLDPFWGTGSPLPLGPGKVSTSVGSTQSIANAIALQPDGKVVLAGTCVNGMVFFGFCAVRYNADGTLDPNFGVGGKVFTISASGTESASALALQPDGKLVLAGSCTNGTDDDFCARRYLANGTLDPSFGSGGKVITAIGGSDERANAIVLQPDGKLVLAGHCHAANTNFEFFCAQRLLANGSFDPSFGNPATGGAIMLNSFTATRNDRAFAIVLQPDGKLVLSGHCADGANRYFCALRYLANGTPDPSFGFEGKVLTNNGGAFNDSGALVLQPDGKLILAGSCNQGVARYFCAVRYLDNGALDSSFGAFGKVITPLGSLGYDTAAALVLQPDGKLVLAGTCAYGSQYEFCALRYHANGTHLDTTFGGSGTLDTPVGLGNASVNAIALQPDGKLILAGNCSNNGSRQDFCSARYDGGPFGYKNCSLDIDGDNRVLATTDSLIHARIALGITGPAVVNGITFPANATRNTWPLIRDYLVTQCGMSLVQ